MARQILLDVLCVGWRNLAAYRNADLSHIFERWQFDAQMLIVATKRGRTANDTDILNADIVEHLRCIRSAYTDRNS
ncbi:hypothetical protein D9M69_481050 [compost metagenome]